MNYNETKKMTETLFNFQLIKWQQVSNSDHYVTEWLLVIENIETLEKYMKKRAKNLIGTYYKMRKKKFTGHCFSENELMLETALTYGREKPVITFIDDCTCIADKILNIYPEIFLIDGIIFITENDCIRPIKNIERKILKAKNKEILAWPLKENYTESDISITRWPGGRHYYAKIKNIEVADENGDSKWNTTEEAKRQAKIFLKTLKMEN